MVKVNISAEGLRALHGSKLSGGIDIKAEQESIKYASEHQPTENYYNRMSREMSDALERKRTENNGSLTIEDREDALMSSFQSIADEIVKGYEIGARVRFVEDRDSEDGYRKLTKEDEGIIPMLILISTRSVLTTVLSAGAHSCRGGRKQKVRGQMA